MIHLVRASLALVAFALSIVVGYIGLVLAPIPMPRQPAYDVIACYLLALAAFGIGAWLILKQPRRRPLTLFGVVAGLIPFSALLPYGVMLLLSAGRPTGSGVAAAFFLGGTAVFAILLIGLPVGALGVWMARLVYRALQHAWYNGARR